jgi:hypothetical protein
LSVPNMVSKRWPESKGRKFVPGMPAGTVLLAAPPSRLKGAVV